MNEETNEVLTPEARAKLSEFGKKGGKAGSKQAKSRAGKKGWRAMIRKVTQADQPDPQIEAIAKGEAPAPSDQPETKPTEQQPTQE